VKRALGTLMVLVLCGGVASRAAGIDWQQRLAEEEERLAAAKTDDERFNFLDSAANAAFQAGELEKARSYAEESLRLAESHRHSWNYGNAVYHGHLILGHAALDRGDVDGAIRELLAAGETPGSPQLNSFGPQMSLAKRLLERSERQAVLTYFEECRRFWKLHFDKLDLWKGQVEAGEMPEFGANLFY
jgi:tetratricopeptide (TPR) repeat protein